MDLFGTQENFFKMGVGIEKKGALAHPRHKKFPSRGEGLGVGNAVIAINGERKIYKKDCGNLFFTINLDCENFRDK